MSVFPNLQIKENECVDGIFDDEIVQKGFLTNLFKSWQIIFVGEVKDVLHNTANVAGDLSGVHVGQHRLYSNRSGVVNLDLVIFLLLHVTGEIGHEH